MSLVMSLVMSDPSRLKRFSFGDHIPIILAADIDNNEFNALTDQISSCCEYLFGGRATVTYATEVRLITALLYLAQQTDVRDF